MRSKLRPRPSCSYLATVRGRVGGLGGTCCLSCCGLSPVQVTAQRACVPTCAVTSSAPVAQSNPGILYVALGVIAVALIWSSQS
jgi:hypothetical protein